MKSKIYTIVGLVLFISSTIADTTSKDNFVDRYHQGFDTDRTGNVIASQHFLKEVPSTDRADILAKILDRAASEQPPNYNVIEHILGFLKSDLKSENKITWNEHLEKIVYKQGKSSNAGVRSEFIDLLDVKDKEKSQSAILSFQDDPSDLIRYQVMNIITRWPQAEEIYKKYIQTHQDDKNYAHSVAGAKANLEVVYQIKRGERQ